MRVSEKWGGDVDAAVELALKELKLTIDEVDVEVLEESSKGFLGIGSKLAKVRVTAKEDKNDRKKEKSSFDDIDRILAALPENQKIEVPEEIREDYDKFEREEMEDARASAKAKKKERHNNKSRNKNRRKEHPVDNSMFDDMKKLDPVTDSPVEKFLRDVTAEMGIDLDFSVRAGNGLIYVNITGKDTGTIIGKRGQTLDAIQYLASIVANKESSEYVRVILDAENYRSKRERTLMNLANRLAGKVERSGRSITLEPMNPYERKVIHSTLQDHPYVKTRSEGKEPYRRVIIERK
ncbi:MAG: RNA-binding cell elongation regulator Jag/EloR [Eubacteriales bacterium]|nr:RNA-binding cell elongation regulator Jag/EloR [Eubacteriales bacterium]